MKLRLVGALLLFFLGASSSRWILAEELTPPTVSSGEIQGTLAPSLNSAQAVQAKSDQDEAVVTKQAQIKKGLREIFAPSSVGDKPAPSGEKVLSKDEMAQLFGKRIEYFKLGGGQKMFGCLFPNGGNAPSVCLDENREILYKTGRDDASVFDALDKRHFPNVKGEEIEW